MWWLDIGVAFNRSGTATIIWVLLFSTTYIHYSVFILTGNLWGSYHQPVNAELTQGTCPRKQKIWRARHWTEVSCGFWVLLSLMLPNCIFPWCFLFQTPCHSWMWLRPTRSSWNRVRNYMMHWWTVTGSPWTQCLQRYLPWCSQDKRSQNGLCEGDKRLVKKFKNFYLFGNVL